MVIFFFNLVHVIIHSADNRLKMFCSFGQIQKKLNRYLLYAHLKKLPSDFSFSRSLWLVLSIDLPLKKNIVIPLKMNLNIF